jgi:hypothetical protein
MKQMKNRYVAFIVLAAGLMLNTFSGYSQDGKLTREEKKAIRKAELEYNFQILDSLLNSKKFVIVADYIQGSNGERTPVNQSQNYIKVNVTTGVFQTGSYTGLGNNSVSGFTTEGTIEVFEITKSTKSLSFTVRFGLLTQLGHYEVLMNVSSENLATATIRGLSYGSLPWEGHIENFARSKMLKGENTR